MKRLLTIFALCAMSAFCATKKPEQFTDDKLLYEYAVQLYQDEQYSEAITFFESLRNRFPQSPYATDSDLKIADANFAKETYAEAEVSYQAFRSLHPTHPKIPYVLLRIGLTHVERSPGGADRDQTETRKAIDVLSELTTRFPSSKEAEEAKRQISKSRRSLAEQELYVANFYLRQREYQAALLRLEALSKNEDFPDLRAEAAYKLGFAHYKLSNYPQAREVLTPLSGNSSAGQYKEKAKDLLGKVPSTSTTKSSP